MTSPCITPSTVICVVERQGPAAALERGGADVLGVADRRVVGHALEVAAEPLLDLGQVKRILQIGVRSSVQRSGLSERRAATGVVDKIDSKGHYGFEVE